MKKLVSLCALLALTFLQSCGSKSEPSAIMSLYQSDRAEISDDSLVSSPDLVKVEHKIKTMTAKLELTWEKEWDNSPKTHYRITRHQTFVLPGKIESLSREAFPGIVVIDLIRPQSNTTLPQELRCVYRQVKADQDYNFEFCTEKNAPIVMGKLEKIKASAMNLINRDHRASIKFELKLGDTITGFFAYPTSLEAHGKTRNRYKASAELDFLK